MKDTDVSQLGPQAAYEAYLAAGRFMIQRAASTGEYVFWPKVTSPTGATDLEWVEAGGQIRDLVGGASAVLEGEV